MRHASILLTLVVMLGKAREAGACPPNIVENHSVIIGDYAFGFCDVEVSVPGTVYGAWTQMCCGPLGDYAVPFTATQGLVGFIVIVAVLFIVPIVVVVGWKWKRAFP